MAFFRDPGEMFLGCLGTVEQRYLVNLIKNAAKNGTITSKNKWQMIEYWAADYLAGK